MNPFDKMLKKLKTDRNTFFTFILTIISIYCVVDRLIEILLIIFTGVSVDYWNPLVYTLVFAIEIFAFLFCFGSKYVKSNQTKTAFFDLYVIGLYILFISMIIQYENAGVWMLLMSVPNYSKIAIDFPELFFPAISALALYIPLVTAPRIFKFLYSEGVYQTRLWQESIWDYGGIKLTKNTKGRGPYSCEMPISSDVETGKAGVICEEGRFNHLLVSGPSGSGKTSLVFEPNMAKDIDKKFFFRNASKELGFAALKSGIATLNCPYSNDYINKNFSLNMLTPVDEKIDMYNKYLNKMIIGNDNGKIIYRDLGITSISPDFESTSRIMQICRNYNFSYNLVDPNNAEGSVGLNPFAYKNPLMTADVLNQLITNINEGIEANINKTFAAQISGQALSHTCCFLKEAFPILYQDKDYLPTVKDVINIFNEPTLIEEMYKRIQSNPDNAEKLDSDKYIEHLTYFKKNFFKDAPNRKNVELNLKYAVAALSSLIKYPGVSNIICNRTNNINFEKALEKGDITLVCTRRGDLGEKSNKTFGIFVILLMQNAVLRRPGTENTRVPNFLYIDEFPAFMSSATEPIFTLYRKYKVGVTIATQSLAQLGSESSAARRLVVANCVNKIVFGNNAIAEDEWWSKELGNKRSWESSRNYDLTKGAYEPKLGGIAWKWVPKYAPDKVRSLPFKKCLYKCKNENGALDIGEGKLDFIQAKYKEPHKTKIYNFEQFSLNTGLSNSALDKQQLNEEIPRFRPGKEPHFQSDVNERFDIDPIKMNQYGLSFKPTDDFAVKDKRRLKNPEKKNNNNNSTSEN